MTAAGGREAEAAPWQLPGPLQSSPQSTVNTPGAMSFGRRDGFGNEVMSRNLVGLIAGPLALLVLVLGFLFFGTWGAVIGFFVLAAAVVFGCLCRYSR